MTDHRLAETVIKVGGSVLRGEADYRAVADRLRPWLDCGAWVVISAAHGVTDELERIASERRPEPVLDLLARHAIWAGEPLPADLASELASAVRDASAPTATILSWGERASAATLRARLSRVGVHVPVAELPCRGLPSTRLAAIVPGFYVRDMRGRVQLFPRGGSDISAVLLAARLHAREVRLWKNGGGLRAPADPTSTLPEVNGYDLLARLGEAIRPLHPAAVRLALRAGVELVLEDPSGQYPSTRIRNLTLGAYGYQPTRQLPETHPIAAARIVPWGRR